MHNFGYISKSKPMVNAGLIHERIFCLQMVKILLVL